MRKRPRTIDLQPWPYDQRPRVLIEHPDPDQALELAAALRRSGCTVAICRGPDLAGERPTRCPLHRFEPCIAVEGADAVVTALGLDRSEAVEVVRGLRTRYPSKPLVVAALPGESLAMEELLRDCTVVPISASPERLASAVTDALAAAPAASGS